MHTPARVCGLPVYWTAKAFQLHHHTHTLHPAWFPHGSSVELSNSEMLLMFSSKRKVHHGLPASGGGALVIIISNTQGLFI